MTVAATLASYHDRVAAAALPYLAGGDDLLVRTHLYDVAADYPARSSKGIRPGLCMATCAAFGGDPSDALLSAVAIELFHNAFLVHDDIQDESELRRGAPTLHNAHGVPLAINAGDALATFAYAALRDNRRALGTRMAAAIADEFASMTRHTLEGQAIELAWRRDNVVDLQPEDYLDLVLRKTCWYTTIHPLRVGALIGSWGRVDLDRLIRFGFYLGAAFQIVDDVLNLTGDQSVYGKEVLGDLYEGKRTLMLIHLLTDVDGSTRCELEWFLGLSRSQRSQDEVRTVYEMMVRHGSIEFARQFAAGIADEARRAAEVALVGVADGPERRFLDELVDWMLVRPA